MLLSSSPLRLPSCVLLMFLVTFASVLKQVESSGNACLDEPMPSMEPLQSVTTETAFATVAFYARLSGGIVEINACPHSATQAKSLHSYVFSGLTLREALDRIVAVDARYKWEVKDKTINLVPVNGISAVLTTRIAHFEIGPKEVVGEVGAKLFNEPLVKKALAERGLMLDDKLQLLIGGRELEFGRSVDLNDTSVLNVLNAAAALNKYPAVWRYSESIGRCEHTYYLDWPVR
jgi:hypothetical protein